VTIDETYIYKNTASKLSAVPAVPNQGNSLTKWFNFRPLICEVRMYSCSDLNHKEICGTLFIAFALCMAVPHRKVVLQNLPESNIRESIFTMPCKILLLSNIDDTSTEHLQ
jgi:hypothetical protein